LLGEAHNSLRLDRGVVDQDNGALVDEVRRLREVQLAEADKEVLRTKELLMEKDEESRNWMENYFALKARF
jgi:hypothetical protein